MGHKKLEACIRAFRSWEAEQFMDFDYQSAATSGDVLRLLWALSVAQGNATLAKELTNEMAKP